MQKSTQMGLHMRATLPKVMDMPIFVYFVNFSYTDYIHRPQIKYVYMARGILVDIAQLGKVNDKPYSTIHMSHLAYGASLGQVHIC